jgi:hypothetical protein
MTKKIRLIDDAPTASIPEATPDEATINAEVSQDLTVTQLMKYLEAIDWKLWEMLKIMKKKEAEEEDK